MNSRDLLFWVAFLFLAVWGYRYFFRSDSVQPAGAQVFAVTHADPDLVAPLDIDVELIDKKPTQAATKELEVATDYGVLTFTTEGAAVDNVLFKRMQNHTLRTFETFHAREKEEKLFFVALDKKTPYYYELIKHKDTGDQVLLTYKAPFEGGSIRKEFTVYKKIHKVDLKVSLDMPQSADSKVRMRMMLRHHSLLVCVITMLKHSSKRVMAASRYIAMLKKLPISSLAVR